MHRAINSNGDEPLEVANSHCAEWLELEEQEGKDRRSRLAAMMPRARMAYEAFQSSAGLEGWLSFADILEARVAVRRSTVCRGPLKGLQGCTEAELIDKLADAGGVVDAAAQRH